MKKLAVTKKSVSRASVQVEIDRVTEKLKALNPRQIFLIGSAATDTLTDQSDLDFVVIFDSVENLRLAQKSLGPHYPLSTLPVEIIWLDQGEFDRKKDLGGIAMEAHTKGELLFSKGVK